MRCVWVIGALNLDIVCYLLFGAWNLLNSKWQLYLDITFEFLKFLWGTTLCLFYFPAIRSRPALPPGSFFLSIGRRRTLFSIISRTSFVTFFDGPFFPQQDLNSTPIPAVLQRMTSPLSITPLSILVPGITSLMI